MGKKKPGQSKKKVVLSLAEFTQDVPTAGVDPDLASLPTAPKAPEEWEALGGRPEYNSRGYKERIHRDRNYDADADFDERDWTRRGPLDEPSGSSFGAGPERDWGDIRRGPLDSEDAAAPERNWEGMRRGPVESSFGSGHVERDWGARKGPIEAEASAPRAISDDQWGSARQGPIEAEFPQQKAEPDWNLRRPVDAGGVPSAGAASSTAEADWSARKGPIEAEFAAETQERDWTARKGPVEAETAKHQPEGDWADVRRRPVQSTFSHQQPEVDWSSRKGPIEPEVEKVRKAVRDIDFSDRRGTKLEELKNTEPDKKLPTEKESSMSRENWRRDTQGVTERRSRQLTQNMETSPPKQDATQNVRDWGAARERSHPIEAKMNSPRRVPSRESISQQQGSAEIAKNVSETQSPQDEGESDWTTVRSSQRRPAGANRRHSGKGFSRRGPRTLARDNKGERDSRSEFSAKEKESHNSDRPLTSAVTDA
ncbi:hypothetical protein FGB62_22g717 [Gracilaria domingensis]|nr:hypothetical protein FGB62_22g717 [Gracilaria domingensis]